MSLSRSILVALAALALCSGCSPTEGNGFVVTVERHVSALFTKVEVEDGLSVEIVRGVQQVSITTDDNLIDSFEADVDGETLKLRLKEHRHVASTFAHVQVSSELLRGLEVSGGSQVTATASQSDDWRLKVRSGSTCSLSDVVAELFDIDVAADSQVDVTSGTVQKIKIEAASNSRASAGDVVAQDAEVKASGSSEVTVQANRELVIEADGNSTISVIGSPTVRTVNADHGSQVTFVNR